MHEFEELLERDVVAAAEDAFQAIRPIERVAADVESKYSDLRRVQRGARTLLGRPEGLLCGDLSEMSSAAAIKKFTPPSARRTADTVIRAQMTEPSGRTKRF